MTESRTRGLVGGPRPRWLPAQLVGLRSETRTARTLTFDVPGWPGHLAGQHVDVRLTAEDGYSAQRAYSISEPVDGEQVSITVQQVGDGEVSPYLVEDMELGDHARGPRSDRRLVRLVALVRRRPSSSRSCWWAVARASYP